MQFKKFIEDTAGDVAKGFEGLAGGFQQGKEAKILEYAKRILAGEDPNVVLQGLANGMRTAVMQKVQELQQPQQQSQQFSVSGLENKLGLRNGTLAVEKSRDGKLVFVRNRLNGNSVSVQPTPQHIEQAARQLFGMVS